MVRSLTFIFFLITISVNANIDFNQNITTIQNEIYNLHFEKAKKLIAIEKKLHPENAAIAACENNLDFMHAFLTEQESDFIKRKDL